ncbi:glycosyltransferase family 2 protein [Petrimonas sp.]|uniref:glycosyltransferase family 2 protein n=1 Tax=Petrimonas sp. TaxID=2023866 RepID=UPI003F50E116
MIVVSIITPLYNSISYIEETINSVLNQTFINWEMLIIDDCSTDGSDEVVKNIIKKDRRVKYFKTIERSGSPTLPRNIGIENASGRFIAFLDSDDVWLPNKLEEQIRLFDSINVAIVFSNYEKINEKGKTNNRLIKAPEKVNYKGLLKGNVMACSTVVYDTEKIGKVYFSNQGHEDFILWLSILKRGYIAKNTNTVGAYYRVRKSSVSSNKFKVIKWIWNIYRNIERLSILKSFYYTVVDLWKSLLKFIK